MKILSLSIHHKNTENSPQNKKYLDTDIATVQVLKESTLDNTLQTGQPKEIFSSEENFADHVKGL